MIRPTDSPLFMLYLQELFWLATAIIRNAEQVFAEAADLEAGDGLKVAPVLHARISSILIDAANTKKLIDTSPRRMRGESEAQFNLRQERSHLLASIVGSAGLEEIRNAKVRNTLEHFDEYLDRAIVQLAQGKAPPARFAAYNLVLSNRDTLDSALLPIRLYYAKSRVFQNLEYEIDIGKICNEAESIVAAIEEFVEDPEDGPGGWLINLEGSGTS
jgi:hypothetical protein